jgi:hypothetical protein
VGELTDAFAKRIYSQPPDKNENENVQGPGAGSLQGAEAFETYKDFVEHEADRRK